MIARPKISRNEWKMAEIGAFEVGNFALFCCPVERVLDAGPEHARAHAHARAEVRLARLRLPRHGAAAAPEDGLEGLAVRDAGPVRVQNGEQPPAVERRHPDAAHGRLEPRPVPQPFAGEAVDDGRQVHGAARRVLLELSEQGRRELAWAAQG